MQALLRKEIAQKAGSADDDEKVLDMQVKTIIS